jgi:hypothetical protein
MGSWPALHGGLDTYHLAEGVSFYAKKAPFRLKKGIIAFFCIVPEFIPLID